MVGGVAWGCGIGPDPLRDGESIWRHVFAIELLIDKGFQTFNPHAS